MDRCKTPEKYSNTQLVPCRWKRTGWTYKNVEHNNHFFRSPNRMNSTGYSQFEKAYGNQTLAA